MCGIFFSASSRAYNDPCEDTVHVLSSRGPDSFERHYVAVSPLSDGGDKALPRARASFYLTFVSTVLALRGDRVQVQPMIDQVSGSVLCWNGEAWKMENQTLIGNDTVHVFEALLQAMKSPPSATNCVENVLTRIAGPYAFVLYDAFSHTIYYGRDRLGRRSLMILIDDHDFVLASTGVGIPRASVEVGTNGIFRIRLNDIKITQDLIPWSTASPDINTLTLTPPDLRPRPSESTVDALLDYLKSSLLLRVTDIPTLSTSTSPPNSAKVAILFSGGLDCTLLARLAHDLLPFAEPIDLLNIAFENPRTIATSFQPTKSSSSTPYESCPDRITGRCSFAELVQVCPQRAWCLVAIDVPYAEVCAHRSTVIKLMHPHNTEMDLSIAIALYFAARGQGTCDAPSNSAPKHYTGSARVLLSGLGADELFAGYTRHKTSFARGGFPGLTSELALDFRRIGTRNLGRDDRVMSHWGKEVRYPYLDEDFVRWALGLPTWEKCGYRNDKEIPRNDEDCSSGGVEREEDLDAAKMLLRLGVWKLGMRRAAAERKRAIQFGARTAKMEVGAKKRGTDVVE